MMVAELDTPCGGVINFELSGTSGIRGRVVIGYWSYNPGEDVMVVCVGRK